MSTPDLDSRAMQLWSITDASAVWAASPALYYATFFELVDAAEAEHGPWPLSDFNAKVVRTIASHFGHLRLDGMLQRLSPSNDENHGLKPFFPSGLTPQVQLPIMPVTVSPHAGRFLLTTGTTSVCALHRPPCSCRRHSRLSWRLRRTR